MASCCSWTTCQLWGPNSPHQPALIKCLLWCHCTISRKISYLAALTTSPMSTGWAWNRSALLYYQKPSLFFKVARYSLRAQFPSFAVTTVLSTFRKSPSYSCLVLATGSASTSSMLWQYCMLDRMVNLQMVTKISCLSIYCTDDICKNLGHHFRSVSWFSPLIWMKSKVLPDERSDTFVF